MQGESWFALLAHHNYDSCAGTEKSQMSLKRDYTQFFRQASKRERCLLVKVADTNGDLWKSACVRGRDDDGRNKSIVKVMLARIFTLEID